jgi:hypothetical protein
LFFLTLGGKGLLLDELPPKIPKYLADEASSQHRRLINSFSFNSQKSYPQRIHLTPGMLARRVAQVMNV